MRLSQTVSDPPVDSKVNASGVSHIPVTDDSGFALENLLKRDYDADTMKMLRLMQKNANRIINLMNQLLDMRKIEKGPSFHFLRRDISISMLCRDHSYGEGWP